MSREADDRVGVDPQIINEGPAEQSFATGWRVHPTLDGKFDASRDECPRYTRRDAAYNSRDTRSNVPRSTNGWYVENRISRGKIIILETGEEAASEKRGIVEIGKRSS